MAKVKTVHRCTECGGSAPRWTGRCPSCEAWNSLVEELEAAPAAAGGRRGGLTGGLGAPAVAAPITVVDGGGARPVPTGLGELDRVLGGGLVPGSVCLLGGEPGAGKSTLLLAMAGRQAAAGRRTLYVSAEEGEGQVRARAERLGALQPELWLLAETVLPHIVAAFGAVRPEVVVIDSVQTVVDPELASAPGSVVQVRECAHRIVQEARARGIAVVLVGHVTKDGTLAGPRVLEHVVDTVLAFEGDRHHALRLLRAVKHRFGPTSELGVFEMTASGLAEVVDASGLFLADRRCGVPGSAVVAAIDGHRPLLVEVQALVTSSPLPAPRRSAQGVDQGRLAMLLAVLQERTGRAFGTFDVYVSAVGGVRLAEPGTDLGTCLALASALAGRPVPPSLVACGEVGLGGEIRQVGQAARRLAEAARLGFGQALVPRSTPADTVGGIELVRVEHLADALTAAGLDADEGGRRRTS
jgi:DNA repair protein RadA/Sms